MDKLMPIVAIVGRPNTGKSSDARCYEHELARNEIDEATKLFCVRLIE